jgi:hypothetical protein
MNIAEILRKLADVVDGAQDEPTSIPHQDQRAELYSAEQEVEHGENSSVINTRSMVAPLQQKLDLMKRLAGEATSDHAVEVDAEDEMSVMRRNAGIPVITAIVADEDEPYEG